MEIESKRKMRECARKKISKAKALKSQNTVLE